MVIAEQRSDGTYSLRGRATLERAIVPFWPCHGATIRSGAIKGAPEAWLKEATEVARELAQPENATWIED
jgi:hypothetical protein